MADWYGSNRSNYFKVKNVGAFEKFLDSWGAKLWKKPDQKTGEMLCGFTSTNDKGNLPDLREEQDHDLEFDDFTKELAEHLEDGEVAIMMEAGAEKLRYITGFALAINSKGETASIALREIYDKAQSLGNVRTRCEY